MHVAVILASLNYLEGYPVKMYRSSQYRKVLAYLLRAGVPVFTKQILSVLGVPEHPSEQQYARGYGVVCRLISRGWAVASPAEAGHVNTISLTAEGKEVAELLEAEVKDIIAIYGDVPLLPNEGAAFEESKQNHEVEEPSSDAFPISPSPVSPPLSPIKKIPSKRIICSQCSESVTLAEAEDAYDEAGKVRCSKCGKDLTRPYLTLKEGCGAT
jgi:ribosomal protein S27AE